MGFGEAISSCFSRFVQFSGRAPRSEYWWFALFLVIVNIITAVLDIALFDAADGFGVFSIIFSLVVLLPSISVAERRLHDIDRSGWWYWIILVPLIGFIVLLVFFVTKGTDGDNGYGPDPLAVRA